MEIVFMETTAQADKFLGIEKKKQYIKDLCAGKKIVSSTYVLGEFKANFLKDATTLYNLVYDSDTLGEAIIRFEETYSSRINKRMNKLFGNIINELDSKDKNEVLDRLEIYIEDILIKRFKTGVDKVLINNTDCLRSIAIPQKVSNVWKLDVKCSQKPIPKCKINEFLLKENIDELKKITTLPCELSKVENTIGELCNNTKKPYGNNCRTLGDVIISLESPKDSCILTSNKKDFEPICNCLNKTIINFNL
jgi:hypothetical protein